MIGDKIVGSSFRSTSAQDPVDRVLQTIRDLVHEGRLQPGDRLPSETVFQNTYKANRHHVRQALQKLEVYGIIRIIPQSGTYLTNLGPKALESMIDNVLTVHEPDFASLADTRTVLEVRAAELAAMNAGCGELEELRQILSSLRNEVEQGNRGLEEDYVLHLKIAQLSKSNVLISLIGMIVPSCLGYSQSVHAGVENARRALAEHEAIVEAIRARDTGKAASTMRHHMEQTYRATLVLLERAR